MTAQPHPTSTPLLVHPAPPMPPHLLRRAAEAAQRLRRMVLATTAMNVAVAALGPVVVWWVMGRCGAREKAPVWAVEAAAVARVAVVVGAGVAQAATAATIVRSCGVDGVEERELRRIRKMRYKRWLWWTRFGFAITALQFLIAFYLLVVVARDLSLAGGSRKCLGGQQVEGGGKKQMLTISFLILVWLVVIVQCFTGSDVLRWRSFYATHDTAWKAHYQEVFDHGIREALCCMGRAKYLSVLEEDEIYSVARLLGDLVAYRASGTGHLELLAGLALLQRHKTPPNVYSEFMEAPEARIREAAVFHPFAEAAYTGPLLDFGRNPILFPCAWLQRQGVLTPWTRSRRPALEGDNWWRGHASAFLKYAKLPPEALRCGRVRQTRREAAYFLVVLHDLKSVVIAVRGTETPEDLITDGLCREGTLSMEDLDGLINGYQLPSHVRESVLSSFPHYGHSGIIESARELFMQLDGQSEESSPSETSGVLSSLLGMGGECHGYNVRIVGHSLGGAVAALLGLRLYGRYPNLHVYAYGPLPCVDLVVAEACSDFVTSIVYNDEFSARLSVNSILRLRAAAISALSVDSSGDSEMISKLVRKFLHPKKYHDNGGNQTSPPPLTPSRDIVEDDNRVHKRKQFKHTIKGGAFLCGYAVSCVMSSPDHQPCSRVKDNLQLPSGIASEPGNLSDRGDYTCTADGSQSVHEGGPIYDDSETKTLKNGIYECDNSDFREDNFFGLSNGYKGTYCDSPSDFSPLGDQASPFPDSSPSSSEVLVGSPEVFLPGLVIHMVPEERSILPLWKSWRVNDRKHVYRAFVANREDFKEIVVTPYMFLDHLPWRCQYALQRVLETQKAQGQLTDDLLNEENMV